MCHRCDQEMQETMEEQPNIIISRALRALRDLSERGDGREAMMLLSAFVTLMRNPLDSLMPFDMVMMSELVDDEHERHTPALKKMQRQYEQRQRDNVLTYAERLLENR